MDNSIKKKILFEISQIEKSLSEGKILVKLANNKEPDYIECSAMALLLHSFYNGVENILLIIAKNIDMKIPEGIKWHKELLDAAFIATKKRGVIFRQDVKDNLGDYLAFRHFIRHAYGFQIHWDKMDFLVRDLGKIWDILKKDLKKFVADN